MKRIIQIMAQKDLLIYIYLINIYHIIKVKIIKLLYSVPYQHYTNAIENFFSVLKNKVRKCNGIDYKELLKNIKIILKEINKNTYKNIFEGSYKRKRLYRI